MNKPMAKGNLIPVRDYVLMNRRGFRASAQYIYYLIKEHKLNGRAIPFKYKEIGQQIWIIKSN
jgi:hypothetical protein